VSLTEDTGQGVVEYINYLLEGLNFYLTAIAVK